MKATDFLSKEEITQFTARSDAWGAWLVVFNWAMIIAVFAIVIHWTNIVTVLLAIPLLGGRQLGLAVLMHEAGHKALFKTASLNQWVGQWFCAYPIMGDVNAYGESHRIHHRFAGTEDDPDLPNYKNYPVSKASFKRKIKRDLTGQTGLLLLHSLVGSAQGRNVMLRDGEETHSEMRGLAVNVAMWLVMLALGVGAYYLLWLVAYFFAYPLIARIRQVAEHGNVPDLYDTDPRKNTRTTYANPLERLLFCPNNVNYHLEHHFLASVPCYRLPALHRLLSQRGFYVGHEDALANGYLDVLRRAVPELQPGGSAAA
ncbi:fatty acid desaturase [Halioglobus japonicus]|uniref:Fatty acid desaturase n=1 Tax=Halioglobus japonicus TaxID=930805 RepID=A0AAP8MI73_9GAMM|nr:fatty acid desaturase family protein [Halioglobus japonicus]AQA19088.1 fatty acid desaturase [Halioglobus japonicus]PLW87889.1 fatty acid desaturase [Halioglobus japonicus]GHD06024.1 fatty acid desaturase [Halioglobus japonicus]